MKPAPFFFAHFDDAILITNDTGAFHFLTPSEFQLLVDGTMNQESELFTHLQNKYFCYGESQESFIRECAPAYSDGNRYLFDPTCLFIFALTNECNNRCVYCQANGMANPCRMNAETAEQALKRIAESPAVSINIEFQGGEPLMNYPVIQYIVNRAPQIMPRKDIQFSLVTNLSLMTDEIATFLKNHNVSVSTSMDGPEDLHDRNRPAAGNKGSFRSMLRGRDILLRHGIHAGAIETTTASSLKSPKQIVHAYAENGFHQIFLRPLTRLGAAARRWDEIGYTPEEFLNFYRKALEEIIRLNHNGFQMVEYHAAIFLSKMLNGQAKNYMELRSPCGAGIGQMAITANGNVYTCDEGRMIAESGDQAFCLGNVFRDDYNVWIESAGCKAVCSASLLETLPGCCDCVYKPYCGVCPVVNYALNGSVTRKSQDRCKIYAGIMEVLFRYLKEQDPEILSLFQSWANHV